MKLSFLLAASLAIASCGPAPTGRTILLISLDSVRADSLSFADAQATPNLARLAQHATIFNQAYSGSSWTLPAHATMFTGAPPPLHGVEFDDIAIDPSYATLPELLKDAGWATAGWWTGWYTAGEYGFSRGFDTYSNAMTGGRQIEAQYKAALDRGDMAAAQKVMNSRDIVGHRDITSPHVVQGLANAVDSTDSKRDLFLFAHLFDPHYDYIPPAPFDTQFDPDYQGSMDGTDFFSNPQVFDTANRQRRISDRDLEHILALYKGEIAFTDQQIGLMLDSLEAAGRLENTLIIVTSDHGEEFFEHGGRGHRATLYDEVLHVPLMVRDPRSTTPREVEAQVGLIDVMPTALGFAGLASPATSTGIDLGPSVAGAPLESRPMLSSLMQHHHQLGYLFVESLRMPDSKLIRTLSLKPGGQLELVRAELFDLGQDSQESRSLTNRKDAPSTKAWSELEAEMAKVRGQWEAAKGTAPEDRATAIREVFEADLADLGYAEGQTPGEPQASPGLGLPWPPGPRPALDF